MSSKCGPNPWQGAVRGASRGVVHVTGGGDLFGTTAGYMTPPKVADGDQPRPRLAVDVWPELV